MAWEKPAASPKIEPQAVEKYGAFDKALLAVENGSKRLDEAHKALIQTRDQIPNIITTAMGMHGAGVEKIAATVANAAAEATRAQMVKILGDASEVINNNAGQMERAAKSMGRRWLRDVALVIVAAAVSVGSVYYIDRTRARDLDNGRMLAAIWPKLSKKAQAEIVKAAEEVSKAPMKAGTPKLPD